MHNVFSAAVEEEIFRKALLVRLVENRIRELYPSDFIQSPVHLSLGQEHHVAALLEALCPEDALFSSYRCHAAYLVKGGSLNSFFAELFGKATGVSGGKAGSMHLSAPEQKMFGSSAIVGSVFSHAVGYAYGQKLLGTGAISVSITGDGSTEEGTFFESLNMAALKKAPVLFLIENNGLAINSPLAERQAYRLDMLGSALGIPYRLVEDGYDFSRVFHAGVEMREKAVSTSGPVILEVVTCRYCEHVGIALSPDSETAHWKQRDPLILNRELVERFRPAIEADIDTAVAFAHASPWPDATALLRDVIE